MVEGACRDTIDSSLFSKDFGRSSAEFPYFPGVISALQATWFLQNVRYCRAASTLRGFVDFSPYAFGQFFIAYAGTSTNISTRS
jgi:hypothetical protein